MSEELKKKIKDFREIEEQRHSDNHDTIRMFMELLLLLHQDLEEIKELLEK